MSSLVLDLQQEVLNADCDILSALRKAHLIAVKLKLSEFDEWIQMELKGYSYKNKDGIPAYRNVKGALKAFNPYNGWIPAQCPDDELEKMICEQKMWQPIGELQDLYLQTTGGSFIYQFPAGQMETICSMFSTPVPMQFALHISSHLLKSIIEQVKNCLLEWTLKLEEKGILGENMTFNNTEAASAKELPQQVNNYYGTIVNGSVSNSQLISGNSNTANYNAGNATQALSDIRESLEKEVILTEDKESALEILEDIKEKIDQGKKPSIIKAGLLGLKDFILSTGANVTAALITAKLQGMF